MTPPLIIRDNLSAIIKGIQDNRILETFCKYYHKDIITYNKGCSINPLQVGFDQNKQFKESFAKNTIIHEAKVLKFYVDDDTSEYELYIHFTHSGIEIKKTQYAIQQWKDGKVIKEELF